MVSDKQLAANRANAQKSTGPKTEEGKRRSALNALRHGLTGHVVVLPEEDLEAYQKFTAGLVASCEPVGDREIHLAQTWADFQWAINRWRTAEENLFTLGRVADLAGNLNIDHPEAHNAMCDAKTFRADSAIFDRLGRYGSRLLRDAANVLKQLDEMQSKRREREQIEMNLAILTYHSHCEGGAAFDPQASGFVFTLEQIEAQAHRDRLRNPNYLRDLVENGRLKAA